MIGFTNKGGTLLSASIYRRYGNAIIDENNLRMFRKINGQIIEFPKKSLVACAYDPFCLKDRNPFNTLDTSGGSYGFSFLSSGSGRAYRPSYEQAKKTLAQIKANASKVVYKENGIFTVTGSNSAIVGPQYADKITLMVEWMQGDNTNGNQVIFKTLGGGNSIFLQFNTNRIEIGVDTNIRASFNIQNSAQFIQDFHTFALKIDQVNQQVDAFIDGEKKCSFNGVFFNPSNSPDYQLGGGNGVALFRNFFGWDNLLDDGEILIAHRWVTNQ